MKKEKVVFALLASLSLFFVGCGSGLGEKSGPGSNNQPQKSAKTIEGSWKMSSITCGGAAVSNPRPNQLNLVVKGTSGSLKWVYASGTNGEFPISVEYPAEGQVKFASNGAATCLKASGAALDCAVDFTYSLPTDAAKFALNEDGTLTVTTPNDRFCELVNSVAAESVIQYAKQ